MFDAAAHAGTRACCIVRMCSCALVLGASTAVGIVGYAHHGNKWKQMEEPKYGWRVAAPPGTADIAHDRNAQWSNGEYNLQMKSSY